MQFVVFVDVICFLTDSNSERPGKVYVPRDENFGDFLIYGIKSLSRKVLPALKSVFDIKFTPNEFDIFEEVQLSCLQKYSAKLVPYLCSRKSSVLMVKSMSSQFSIPHLIKGILIIYKDLYIFKVWRTILNKKKCKGICNNSYPLNKN